jgi:hypothetical protein
MSEERNKSITCACGSLQELGINAPHESLIHQLYEELDAADAVDQIAIVTLWMNFEKEMAKPFDASLGLTAIAIVDQLKSS